MQKTVLANTDELNTRAKILRAAKQAFLNKGFAHTNVRTIAAEAGVTTGAVYNLFKNKDSIFDALTGAVFGEFLTVLAQSSARGSEEVDMKNLDLSAIMELSRGLLCKDNRFFLW